MTDEIIIRPSALTRWPDCNRRGAAHLLRREIQAAGFRLRRLRRGIGAAIGSAVHAAAEITLDEKAKSGALPPASVATDIAAQSLQRALAEGEILYDGPNGVTHNRSDASRQTVRMAAAYHRVAAPLIEPILVEQRLEAEVVPGIILSGQPDIVAREPRGIKDLKTGRQIGTHAPQIGAYGVLARSHGFAIDEASIDFLARVRVDKPQPDPISKPVPIAQAETAATNIIGHIEGDLKTFRQGDAVRRILPGDPWAFQANPNSILCDPKYCAAFGTEFCREGDPDKMKAAA